MLPYLNVLTAIFGCFHITVPMPSKTMSLLLLNSPSIQPSISCLIVILFICFIRYLRIRTLYAYPDTVLFIDCTECVHKNYLRCFYRIEPFSSSVGKTDTFRPPVQKEASVALNKPETERRYFRVPSIHVCVLMTENGGAVVRNRLAPIRRQIAFWCRYVRTAGSDWNNS